MQVRQVFDLGRLHVADAVGLEAGEAVRDQFWEHRNHPLRQVHARRPLAGLLIELAPGRGEVADIGDVDGQDPVLRLGIDFHTDGVVEVAGVHGVDGDDELACEIRSTLQVRFLEMVGLGSGLGEDIRRKLVRQAQAADDRECIHARLAVRAEHFGDGPFAAFVGRGEADHVHDDLIVRLRPFRAGVADGDGVREHGAVDANVALAVAFEVLAHERPRGPFQDIDDIANRVGHPARLAAELYEYFVARGRVEFVARADADVRARRQAPGRGPGANEAEAGVRPPVRADDGTRDVCLAEHVVPAHVDPTLADEPLHDAAKQRVVFVRHAELLRELLGFQRGIAAGGDRGEDLVFHVAVNDTRPPTSLPRLRAPLRREPAARGPNPSRRRSNSRRASPPIGPPGPGP